MYCSLSVSLSLSLSLSLSTDQPDIVCITETWFTNTVSDSMINGKGDYKVLRTHRTSDGGGVCILCKINPSYKLTVEQILPADKYQTLETVVVFVSVGDDKIRLITVYRLTTYTVDGVANASLLADLLADVIKVEYSCCIIGDFNLPKVNWLTYPSDSVHDIIVNYLRLGLTGLSTFLPEIMLFLTSSSLTIPCYFHKYLVMHNLAIVIITAFHVHLFAMRGHLI